MDQKNFGGLLLACALAAPLSAAADDIFLKLEGYLGDSVDAHHRNEIDIRSYSHSFSGAFSRNTTAAAAKNVCGPVSVQKYVDRSSANLMKLAANGFHIPSAVITFRKSGQTPIEYYKVKMSDVIVTDVSQGGARGESGMSETVTLIGRRFEFEYNGQRPDGSGSGAVTSKWDCIKNAEG